MNLREIKISANFREYLRERLLTINFEKNEKRNLEIYRSDDTGHSFGHCHQPGCYIMHGMRIKNYELRIKS